ncbi:LAME_0G17106g1_1 [Lachancea meyersii CBS 8951]|uniref:LAME_0G17106g1_1 n=1 Tax=Lachancea meyersii CBS 8951 TaxID=1266667 RepID=A0A1G4KBB4_9SACH|nr:LAME_0G17106g1_1 [Lachancea meyersii CBS 8951]
MSSARLDAYITSSIALLEANPSSTLVSIRYQIGAKAGKVTFRTTNSELLARYKYSTSKSKDVSRLLSALGPRGVSIQPSSKVARQRKTFQMSRPTDVTGMATLMANVDVPEAVEEVLQPKPAAKKKKKGKKR